MKKDMVSAIIQRAYARKYNLAPTAELVARRRPLTSVIRPLIWAIQQRKLRLLAGILVLAIIAGSIYYYNLLVSTEQDVLAAKGQVYALQQRRHDISINLSKAVYDYSRHERSVFTAVVALRSLFTKKGGEVPALEKLLEESNLFEAPLPEGVPGQIAGALPASALDRILALAEQYPDLKLAANFQNLMGGLTEVEKDLATQRMDLNNAINIYTTNVAKFPTNFYAWLFGFDRIPYFEAREEAKRFRPIEY